MPGIVEAYNAVSILTSSVHHWTAYFLKVFPQNLTMFYDVFTIGDMENSTVIVSNFFDDPRHFRGSNPLACIFEFLFCSEVDSINDFLNFCESGHDWDSAMILQVKPGENCLKRAIGASPAMIVERLVSIVKIFINSFGIVFNEFLFWLSFVEDVRVKYLLRNQRYKCR